MRKDCFSRETSPGNRAEEALRKSEEKFSKVFFSTPAILAITTVSDGRFIELNESFERSFGYCREEVIGRTALELNIWKDPAERDRMIADLRRTGKVHEFEANFRHKDGRTLVGLYSTEYIEINGEQCLLSLMSDITKRKEVEESLRESEERFRCFYHDTPVMLHSIDRDGRLIGVSNYWLEVLGYQQSEVLGRKSTDFLTEESRRYAETVVLPEYFKTGVCKDVQYQVVKKSGEVLDVLLTASAVRGPAGETVRSLAVMTDVTAWKRAETALKASEERYRVMVETAQEGILALDAEGAFTYVNRQFAEMLGQGAAGILGRPYLDFIDPGAQAEVRDRLERRKNGMPERYDTVFLRGDGTRMWGSVSAITVLGPKGEFIGSFGMVTDITQRKQALAEIETLNTKLSARACELESANEELEAFNYTVSHDLRKPLTAISGFGQVILSMCRNDVNQECQEYVREMVNGTTRMSHLIDTLLSFSHKTRSELKRETVELSAMVQEVIAEHRLTQPQRQVACTVEQGVTAEGDPRLLRVVLDNLMGNAWKYTAKNPEALIEFGVTGHHGQRAYFVRDNGAGFDMSTAERLFAPFQRLHEADEFEGTGIGLATVQRIIQRHGGEVWAEGKIGAGATFYFTLG